MTGRNESERKGDAWNKFITPNLEAIHSGLRQPFWEKGVELFLIECKDSLQRLLNKGCKNPRDEDKLRGQILQLAELIELRARINHVVEVAEQNKTRPKPSGDAGY